MIVRTRNIQSEAETAALALAIAYQLPDPSVVALEGPLGAGKTRFVQALATGLQVPADQVTSPTFTLVHEYCGARPIRHIDAYRIRDDDEFLQLGVDEMFSAPGLTLVEWASRVQGCLPPDTLWIELYPTGETTRHITIRGDAIRYADLWQVV